MSNSNENKELIKILKSTSQVGEPCCSSSSWNDSSDDYDDDEPECHFVQWTTHNGRVFVPSGKTADCLVPGVYEINTSQSMGLYFERIPVKTEGLIRFPDTTSDRILLEIKNFWEREQIFRQYGLTYKRGILLWGDPGMGKSATVQMIMADVVQRGGIVINFDAPSLFIDGMRILRQIQPSTPVVVIMEDIDSIIENYSESEVLNILDGVHQVQKVIFLATTNYPAQLGGRIVNRPSRFDKRFKIGPPNAKSRRMYFENIIGRDRMQEHNIDLNRWVKDTKDLSIAHLKELFIAVVILGDNYAEAIETLQSMKEVIKTNDEEFGFGTTGNKDD